MRGTGVLMALGCLLALSVMAAPAQAHQKVYRVQRDVTVTHHVVARPVLLGSCRTCYLRARPLVAGAVVAYAVPAERVVQTKEVHRVRCINCRH